MVIVSLKSIPGGIQLLDASLLRGTSAKGQGVVNLCLAAPVDGVAFSVNENADPDVRTDHLAAIPRLHPPPGAVQALLFKKSLTLPYIDNIFCLGTWQGIYLIDLRESGAEPINIVVTCRASSKRDAFTVDAAARNATQLESEIAKRMPVNDGALLVHEMHTSASLSVGTGNLEHVMNRVVPEKWHHEFFQHTLEGVDDMTGHLKCSLLGCSATVPVLERQPLLPLRLNEHRYGGGYGGGHQRRIIVDHVPPAALDPYEFAVDGTMEIGAELSRRGAELLNVVVGKGSGGLLIGSQQAVGNYKAPDDVILAQTVDWPAEASASGGQLWWHGGAATLRVTPM